MKSPRNQRLRRDFAGAPVMRRQQGQAVVLIALMITVLIGMVALAVDGSRGFAMRRDLQAAVDAAALAAGDNFQQTASYSSAEQAATSIFGTNLRLYTNPPCNPSYGSPGPSPLTINCTYPDGTVLTQQVVSLGAQGSQFNLSARRTLQLNFGGLLTNGVNPAVAGAASGTVNNLLYAPTVAALNQGGCSGSGNPLSVNGSGTLSITGDVVANGTVNVLSGAMSVAGDIYARCQSSIAGATNTCYSSGLGGPCTFPDVMGAVRSGFKIADPSYPIPPLNGTAQGIPGANVVIYPGTYAANPLIGAGRCYFLTAGVYTWRSGYRANGGFVSNELKPPDEPSPTDITQLAAKQFWNTNGVNCAGSFKLTATAGSGSTVGTYGFRLTSIRTDTYNGVSYTRESAPSRCQSLTVNISQVATATVSNVPGAQAYRLYMSTNGCTPPFGLVYTLDVTGTPENDNLSGCPWGPCSLGQTMVSAPAFILAGLPLPNAAAAPGTPGSYPPDDERAPLQAGLPNQNAPRLTPPAGGRGNENECVTAGGGVLVSCPAAVTPGAVVFYIPTGGCLNATSTSDTFIFSGYQYDWISVYEPGAGNPPANTCPNVIAAAGNSAYIGLVYLPSASLNVQSSTTFESQATAGIMADTVSFTGSLPIITYGAGYAPIRPASRLSS
ncbi:MAG TPA: pilus assembly protein TadG-related protein [Candidatus Dormibacteraeota bacterium]|nr:pilus assembly protein TadG-related protein [Candidatus Dormibacteraeota bacterium]